MEGADRQPWSREAEVAVLGSILKSPELLVEVGNELEVEGFYNERHRIIYRTVLTLEEAGKRIDAVTLIERLSANGELDTAGGAQYIHKLIDDTPSALNHEQYVEIVVEKARRRAMIAISRDAQQRARDEATSLQAVTDEIAQSFLDLAAGSAQKHTRAMADVASDVFDKVQEMAQKTSEHGFTGLPSGFYALDRMTSGWQPSDLIILAARPGMGKTAFALNLLTNAATHHKDPAVVLIFSLEMSAEQLVFRVASSVSAVPLRDLRTGQLDKLSRDKFYSTIQDLSRTKFFIHDRAPLTLPEVARVARQIYHEHGLDIIAIDYLQLMQGSSLRKNSNREQEISEISRGLKALAKELEVPIIALSQLNRAVESRKPPIPKLSDLRESGAIEQDADIIIFLYREKYYRELAAAEQGGDAAAIAKERQASSGPDEAEVIIAKHRSGETGKVKLLFIGERTTFANLSADVPLPSEDDFGPEAAKESRTAGDPLAPFQNLKEPEPQPEPGSRPTPPPIQDSGFDDFDFDTEGFAELPDDDDDLPL